MTFTALRGAGLALLLATAAQAEDPVEAYRVFVADHAEPKVTAFDLNAPGTRWEFEIAGQAKLIPVADGAVIAAVQSDADQVRFIASGVTLEDHGDHADIAISDPAAIGAPLTGARPFHVVDHGGETVIHFDRGGRADLLSNAALKDGRIEIAQFPQARAHHGFAAPFGGVILSTVASDAPVEGDAAPVRLGLRAFDRSGSPVGDLAPCGGIHGEAFSGAYLAAGCAEGVLTATPGPNGAIAYRMLPYPADFPAATTGTLLGAKAMQIFLGNHGPDGLVVVDPAGEPAMTRVALPFRRVDFALDPADPAMAYVLTEDGRLHRVDLLAAKITASAPVTGTYSMDGHWNDPRPRLAVADGIIAMSDPRAGLARLISTETLKETGRIEIGGQPYDIAIVGGAGATH